MSVTHIHVGVVDLDQAVQWFKNVLIATPKTGKDFAVFDFCNTKLVLDKAEKDTSIIIGFQSVNCDDDFANIVKRGGIAIAEPRDYISTGSRAAIIQGPGAIKIEVDQSLS